jgi:hypothetical protein
VAHACNPSYSEAEIRRIVVQSQPRQIDCKTLSQKKKKKSQKWAGGVAKALSSKFSVEKKNYFPCRQIREIEQWLGHLSFVD